MIFESPVVMRSGHILEIRAAVDIGQRGHFLMKKGHQKFYLPPPFPIPPYSIPSLSVLHQNKALYNFHERGQRSIVERNIGLEYALETAMFLRKSSWDLREWDLGPGPF